MSQTLATTAEPTNARQWDVAVLVVALLYFALRAGWYALNIAPNVPPDEKAHLAISEIFAKTVMLPSDSPESYRYGLVTHGPSLYYYLMGRAANMFARLS